MNRYLLHISYIGTPFRGIQRTINKAENIFIDPYSIQGRIEIALSKLRPLNPIQICLSSRTDAGVHALQSSVHVDLERQNGAAYCPLTITSNLNRYFLKNSLPIRVIETKHVPETFHCRFNAKARTYLYRIAVSKTQQTESESNRKLEAFVPIEDIDRCYYIHNSNFNIDALIEASTLFIGRHDFRTFMNTQKNSIKQESPSYTIKKITKFEIKKGKPLINSIDFEKAIKLYDYWNIEISGSSFLYKQVRRMVGSLIALGNGQITKHDIYEMLTIPSKNSWISRTFVIPPFALYLCKVHYDENDYKLENPEEKH